MWKGFVFGTVPVMAVVTVVDPGSPFTSLCCPDMGLLLYCRRRYVRVFKGEVIIVVWGQ